MKITTPFRKHNTYIKSFRVAACIGSGAVTARETRRQPILSCSSEGGASVLGGRGESHALYKECLQWLSGCNTGNGVYSILTDKTLLFIGERRTIYFNFH